jgi:Major capsid protein N-terminus/Large eukaryotic DNA virus major capsid protein
MAQLQLAARGVQDAALESDDLGASIFQPAAHQHTRFASEHKTLIFKGEASYGGRCAIPLDRLGDLVHSVMLVATVKRSSDEQSWYPMEALCERVSVWIGGQKIDEHPATFFRVYDELYRDPDERQAYQTLTNFHVDDPEGSVKTLYLPLLFWFCRDMSKALPLIGLPYADVEIVVDLAARVDGLDTSWAPTIGLSVEYIYLNDAERALVASAERTLLVDTLQVHEERVEIGDTLATHKIELTFNHPCKSLIWCFRGDKHGVFTGSGKPLEPGEGYAPLASARLVVSGHDREKQRSGAWYRAVHALHHSGRLPSAGVYTWDFCLSPRAAGPTGSMNMSRLDGVALYLTTKRGVSDVALQSNNEGDAGIANLHTVTVMAPSWNFLVFKEGMAGLKFSS